MYFASSNANFHIKLAFDEEIMSLGFMRSDHDQCVYVKCTQGVYIYLLFYVDDMLVACMNMKLIKDLKQQLSTRFEIKDLGAARSILGIDIVCDKKNGALLS